MSDDKFDFWASAALWFAFAVYLHFNPWILEPLFVLYESLGFA